MGVLVDPNRVPADPSGNKGILSDIMDGATGLGDAMGAGFGGMVSGMAGGLLAGLLGGGSGGRWSPMEEVGQQIRNGQEGLENSINLLFGLPGYGFSYMSRNINAEWGVFGGNVRRMPFDKQLGPAKNTRIDSQGRLVLDGVGAWLVMVKNRARGTGYGGNAMIQQTVRIRRPDGTVYHTVTDDASTMSDTGVVNPKGASTLLSIFPVVIDEPGCTVDVETWTGAWRWWDGGYRYSMMAAIRHSTDVENRGDETVRDETRDEANQG